MNTATASASPIVHDSWYKYGVCVLILEMVIAIAVCGYSIFMTFHGAGGIPGKY